MENNGGIGLCCKDVTSNKVPNFNALRGTASKSRSTASLLRSSSSNQVSKDIIVNSTKSSQVLTKNITDEAGIESKRGGNGNKKGTSEYSHSRFQRQRKGVYELGQYALTTTIAAAKILETVRMGNSNVFCLLVSNAFVFIL